METEKVILEAQERLEKKREERKATVLNIPQTMNFHEEIQEIGRRGMELARQRAEIEAARALIEDREPKKPEEPAAPPVPEINRHIPKAYRECRFDTFQGNDKLAQGLMKLADTGCDIVLRGETGCGKTHLAVAIMQHIGHGYFTTAPELLLRIRSTFNEGPGESEGQVISDLCRHETLILDDLGAEKTTEFAITTLYIIIDRRIRDAKRTIITTNLGLKEIEDKLDARIASRLSGMQNVKINMPDHRKKR